MFVTATARRVPSVDGLPEGLRQLTAFFISFSCSSNFASSKEQQDNGETFVPVGKVKGQAVIGGNNTDQALLRFLESPEKRDKLLGFNPKNQASFEDDLLFSSEHKFSAVQLRLGQDLLSLLLPPNRQQLSQDVNTLPVSKHQIGDADVFNISPLPSPSHPSHTSQTAPLQARSLYGSITLVKGSPEELLPHCTQRYASDGSLATMNPLQHSRLLSEINDLSKSGWFTHLWLVLSPFNCNDYSPLPGKRLLALATCRCPIKEMKLSKESVLGENQEAAQAGRYRLPHNSLSLLGVIAVGDQPRVMCKRSLELAAKAGVQVVMVTGDRIATAVSVAKTIGLVQDDEKGGASLSKTNSALTDPNQPLESTLTSRISLGFLLSSDLAQMSDRQLEIVSC